MVARQVKKLPVGDAAAEVVQRPGCALVAVGNHVADQASVLIERRPIDSPRVDRHRAGVGEALKGLLQADDRFGLHRRHVPGEGPILAALGLVLEAVNVGDDQASVVKRSGEDSPGRGSEVNSKYGGH